MLKRILLILPVIAASLFCSAQKKYDFVKDFGAKADDRTDCYDALLKAAATISRAGGGTLNIPKGKYYIAKYKIIGGKSANGVKDIVFSDCKNIVINGNGSSFRVNGHFLRTNDYGADGVVYRYSYSNTVSPFIFKNCSGVLLQDLNVDGGVKTMTRDGAVVEGNSFGVGVDDTDEKDKSNHITFKNVAANCFATDGIYIRCKGDDIKILQCTAKFNARQGLSIVSGKNILVDKCVFDSTGYSGSYAWHPPGAGIDIENEGGKNALKDVLIKNCRLRCNKGFQIVTTLQSENVRIDSCFIADTTYGRSDCLNGVGMYSLNSSLTNCILFAGIQVEVADQIYKGQPAQQYTGNIIYSAGRGITSSDFQRPCNISDNILVMLPSAAVNEYFPYIQNVNAVFNNNIIATQADKVMKVPDQIIGLVQYGKETGHNAWLVNGITKDNKTFFSKHYYLIALSASKMYKHYFPKNDRTKTFPDPSCLLFPDGVADKIMAYSLFRAYNQRSFDKQWLVQAAQVRKYFSSF